MDENKRGFLFNFLHSHSLCVLATSNLGKPEASVVMFGLTKHLELVVNTFPDARKVENILENPQVAAVIGWGENITVQYEGKATKLEGDELEKYKKLYEEKNHRNVKWKLKRGMIFFKIKPSWIRYTNIDKDPWEIFEVYDF